LDEAATGDLSGLFYYTAIAIITVSDSCAVIHDVNDGYKCKMCRQLIECY